MDGGESLIFGTRRWSSPHSKRGGGGIHFCSSVTNPGTFRGRGGRGWFLIPNVAFDRPKGADSIHQPGQEHWHSFSHWQGELVTWDICSLPIHQAKSMLGTTISSIRNWICSSRNLPKLDGYPCNHVIDSILFRYGLICNLLNPITKLIVNSYIIFSFRARHHYIP